MRRNHFAVLCLALTFILTGCGSSGIKLHRPDRSTERPVLTAPVKQPVRDTDAVTAAPPHPAAVPKTAPVPQTQTRVVIHGDDIKVERQTIAEEPLPAPSASNEAELNRQINNLLAQIHDQQTTIGRLTKRNAKLVSDNAALTKEVAETAEKVTSLTTENGSLEAAIAARDETTAEQKTTIDSQRRTSVTDKGTINRLANENVSLRQNRGHVIPWAWTLGVAFIVFALTALLMWIVMVRSIKRREGPLEAEIDRLGQELEKLRQEKAVLEHELDERDKVIEQETTRTTVHATGTPQPHARGASEPTMVGFAFSEPQASVTSVAPAAPPIAPPRFSAVTGDDPEPIDLGPPPAGIPEKERAFRDGRLGNPTQPPFPAFDNSVWATLKRNLRNQWNGPVRFWFGWLLSKLKLRKPPS